MSGTVAPLAVLMTTFNRCEVTLRGLEALHAAAAHAEVAIDVYILDDASTDHTAERVRERFPRVRLIEGGNLYWCRGMHRAFAAALAHRHRFYLWLNDDTVLKTDALQRLLACEASLRLDATDSPPLIVVGSTTDPSGRLSYGGERQASRLRPLSLVLQTPGDAPRRIDTMNGNIVLINASAAALVGNLDARFEHAMGDTDYGLRAKRLGVGLWLAPGVGGECSLNPLGGTFQDASLSTRQRLRLMLSRKGLPWRSWLLLTWRHGGWSWWLLFAWPYLRVLSMGLQRRVIGAPVPNR